jgi:hypothetical protein
MKKLWESIGGRKFLALLLACGVYCYKGTFDMNLALIFIAYMAANVGVKWLDGKPQIGPTNGGGE